MYNSLMMKRKGTEMGFEKVVLAEVANVLKSDDKHPSRMVLCLLNALLMKL